MLDFVVPLVQRKKKVKLHSGIPGCSGWLSSTLRIFYTSANVLLSFMIETS